jgi:bis(5'-nucleosyl)-tetraphosphatase (symmetrical)
LLESIHFNEREDRLWFVGDLVNRGPDSLAVLRFIKQLPLSPIVTLGNHDLHLLSRLFSKTAWHSSEDTLDEILSAPDAEELGHWLRKQSILHHDTDLNVVMCHAGIAPLWTLEKAKQLALELETVLQGEHYKIFLDHMYGNEPHLWSEEWTGVVRWRLICNHFTRMRFCNQDGGLVLTYKGTLENAPPGLYPWYNVPHRNNIEPDLVFGHWAALQGQLIHPKIHAIDTGCLWGGPLTALRLKDKQRFSVPGAVVDGSS